MPDATEPTEVRHGFSFTTNFLVILGSFCLLLALFLPTLLSFDYWIFKDRSAFLNLDYLISKHYRLGVDICYSYGLLPVLVQHLVCLAFGRSFRPLLGCTLLVMVVSAFFWAALLEYLPKGRTWLVAVVALSQILLVINPKLPYSMAVLSILFALLYVIKGRLDSALAVSVIGCFSVPSLPLLLAVLIVCGILANWWQSSERSLKHLTRQLAPGVLLYVGLALLLGMIFSFPSVASTALPLAGADFYKENHLSSFSAFLDFLHPPDNSWKYYILYYLGSSVTWFTLCSIFLAGMAVRIVAPLAKGKPLQPREMFVLFGAILQVVFVCFAYGVRDQHIIYECVLAAATMVGISLLPGERIRRAALIVYLGVGVLGQAGAMYKTMVSWRESAPSPDAFGLFAYPDQMREWSDILAMSQHHRTLMLGYATGEHLYYPTVENPDAWFLMKGLIFPSQKQAILGEIRAADIVVEDRTSWYQISGKDADIKAELAKMHMTHSTANFGVWQRDGTP
jgi:hypothetical protein